MVVQAHRSSAFLEEDGECTMIVSGELVRPTWIDRFQGSAFVMYPKISRGFPNYAQGVEICN
jgi:hypothetical protein